MDGLRAEKRKAILTGRDYACLIALSAILFGFSLVGGRVLTLHEARLPQTSREMASNGDWLVPRSGGRPWLERPPLPHWITVATIKIFGHDDQEWVHRIPPALAGICCVLLTSWIAAGWFGRAMGMMSGLMLATSFEFLRYAWMAEEDVFLAAAVLLGMALFVQLEFFQPRAPTESTHFFGNRPTLVWIFFLTMGLSNLVKGLFFAAVMVGLTGGTFLLWNRDRRAILRYVWCWGAILFALTGCAWCWGVSREYPEMLRIWMGDVTNRTDGNWSRSPVWYYAECLAWSMLPWTLPMLLGLWEQAKAAWYRPGSPPRLLICWGVAPLLFLSLPAHKHHHYLVPCLAPWAILAALGSRTLWETVPHWPGWLRKPFPSAVFSGISCAVVVWIARDKIPGPAWTLFALPLFAALAAIIIGQGLILRRGQSSFAAVLGVVFVAYCFGHWYSGQYVDTYREDTRFLKAARLSVPAQEPIYVNADGAILNTFRNVFYLGNRGVVLHNLSFLRDQNIPNGTIHVIARRGAREELADYGEAEVIEESRQRATSRRDEDRWALYRVRLQPDLPKFENNLRVSALQAMEREQGPYLGRQ